MRLIDADALKYHLEDLRSYTELEEPDAYYRGETNALKVAIGRIDRAPTIDAAHVVRCKDCRHYKVSPGQCPATETGDPRYDWTPAPNWYCADGERKDTGDRKD